MLFSLVYVAIAIVMSMIPAVGAVEGLPAECTCAGATSSAMNATNYLCGDELLGPAPATLLHTPLLVHYKQLGNLCPDAWLKKYTQDRRYIFPPYGGFQLSSAQLPINGLEVLGPGMLVDRFGADTGKFVAPAYTPVLQRALPPKTLNLAQYSVYEVQKNLTVVVGTTAAAFEQPGQGTQYDLQQPIHDWVCAKFLKCIEGCSAERAC
ncbi:hypothetical protein C8J57DRAFT_1535430 [Mycena rebaudengoi]|nr:hypothetical protein C8J57DRAFT_1535430 [Mycena rebaudengoi]